MILRIILGTAAAAAVLVILIAAANVWVQGTHGLEKGKLRPCPSRPNCVSSQHLDRERFAAPIAYLASARETRQRLRQAMASLPRTELVEEKPNYLRYTVTSRICRFVDDVEFLFDDSSRLVHVRSASRVGYSDLGVNRERVEEIRRRMGL